MSAFHFLRPWWLLGFFPLAYGIWYLYHSTRPTNIWSKVCDMHLLPHLLVGRWQQQHRYSLLFLATAWGLCIIALSGPTWSHLPAPVFQSNKATVIALDLSTSMLAEDIKPSRLARAKFKTIDILNHIREGQVALVAFTTEAFVVSPLTDDAMTIHDFVDDLDPSIMPVQGSSMADALSRSAQLFADMKLSHGHLILITAATPTADEIAHVKKLKSQGITTSILGMGTPGGAPIPTQDGFLRTEQGETILSQLDETILQKMATAGGGLYQRYQSSEKDIETLLAQQSEQSNFGLEKNELALTNHWFDQGPHILLLLLPLVALSFRRGWMESLLRS